MKKYQCKKCKYIYDEENESKLFNDLDKSWTCPFCDSTTENFEEIIINQPLTEDKKVWISDNNPSIKRIIEKCINCGMCKKVCQNTVGINYDNKQVKGPVCINCGQCIQACPVGALVPKYDYKTVLNYLNDTNYTIICSIAPAVRTAIGEEFNMQPGEIVIDKMVGALKSIKFDYVFDLTFGADLTIMEEATELVKRIETNNNLPQFTSCCPSWVKYAEIYHPEIIPNLSTTKSPISMQGIIIKKYFAKLKGINPEKIINVMIAPCTAKKYEIKRQELPGMDFVLTTRELANMLKESNIDLNTVKAQPFDPMLQEGSGAGTIFGATGGVMESAIRTAYYIMTKKNPPQNLLNLTELRGLNSIKIAKVYIEKKEINVCVVYGMKNLEQVLKEKEKYDFIEVMNCPGGCIAGGGQPLVPISKIETTKLERIQGLYKIDSAKKIRTSYSNPDIIDLYKIYLEKPGSEESIKILHTTYSSKTKDYFQ